MTSSTVPPALRPLLVGREEELWRRKVSYSSEAVDLISAAREICELPEKFQVSVADAIILRDGVRNAQSHDTREAADNICGVLSDFATQHWSEFEAALGRAAADRLEDPSLEGFLADWRPLRKSRTALSFAMQQLETVKSLSERTVSNLRFFSGRDDDLRSALETLVLRNGVEGAGDGPVWLICSWSTGSAWSDLVFRMFDDAAAERSGSDYSRYTTGHTYRSEFWELRLRTLGQVKQRRNLDDVATALAQLPKRFSGGHPQIDLGRLAPETRAAWRARLNLAVGSDLPLRSATAEVLLWLTPEYHDDEAQLAAAELVDGQDAALQALDAVASGHPSLLAQMRASAVSSALKGDTSATVSRMHSVPSMVQRIANLNVPTGEEPTAHARTWLSDPILEDLIERTISTVEKAFALEYPRAADQDEEQLGGRLFTMLEARLSALDAGLLAFARSTDSESRTSVSLRYRPVSKAEEGAPGAVESASFSADLCLVFTAKRDGKTFARRVTLVQAKRLYRDDGKGWRDHYVINRPQLVDLTKQSLSAFLAFYGPGEGGAGVAILPAQLVIELMDREGLKGRVHRATIVQAVKSLAHWMTYDVIGLWVGDPGSVIVNKANGSMGAPYSMLELDVEVQTRSSDR